MFNPLVDSFSELKDAEIENKIVELQRKYFQAGANPQLQQQVQAILEMYKLEMQERRAKSLKQQNQQDGDNSLDNLINIS
jgi:heterodisulfide reductase subunit C